LFQAKQQPSSLGDPDARRASLQARRENSRAGRSVTSIRWADVTAAKISSNS
jgi:hypothetical protein